MEKDATAWLANSAAPSPEPDHLTETLTDFQTDMAGPSQSQSRLEDDLRAMLQALPTRADIEALIFCIEEAHGRDMQEVRNDLQSLTDRVSTRETSVSSLENWVAALERSEDTHSAAALEMQLHLEEMEDRSRRNNLRLRGIPKAIGSEGGDSHGHIPQAHGSPAAFPRN